ncbi:hypothetical protein FNE76_03885 [Helicobacter mehlei]|uniref:Uncharacterized protein n=1 Tax=Helicobacter mehlei TaxID=2316080 RepID=A0A553UWZ3_9HELI|nr:hypothetical protein [Helicobacter mehlei]TSA84719.1 hypothetical protein FNE76_03885 [Helicobacter mehlei]
MKVSNEAELAEAIQSGVSTIEIEGGLKNKVIKIKATGAAAWAVAITAIVVAVTATIASGGLVAPASLFTVAGAVGILGTAPTISAVTIAVVAGVSVC